MDSQGPLRIPFIFKIFFGVGVDLMMKLSMWGSHRLLKNVIIIVYFRYIRMVESILIDLN